MQPVRARRLLLAAPVTTPLADERPGRARQAAVRTSLLGRSALAFGVCLALLGCQKGGGGAKDGGETYDPYEEPGPEPKMSERTLPECKLEGPPPEFPPETEGLAFRGLVRLVIGSDGKPTDVCFARAEGPLLYEKRALAEKSSWKYDAAYAGQPREKVVTYRLNPAP